MGALVQATAEDLAVAAQSKNIELSAQSVPITMMGMEDALRLMITNLTDNAIRYTPEGGRIRIAVAPDCTVHARQAIITVTDNGPGIAPEERERVFERFYRALAPRFQVLVLDCHCQSHCCHARWKHLYPGWLSP